MIEKYRDRICGLIADAAIREVKGGELSVKMRHWFRSVDQAIGDIYDESQALAHAKNGDKPPVKIDPSARPTTPAGNPPPAQQPRKT